MFGSRDHSFRLDSSALPFRPHWRKIAVFHPIMIVKPYHLFLGDARDDLAAKTSCGVAQWRPDDCVGQFRMGGCAADTGLPDLSMQEAVGRGAKTLIVGVVNAGGVLAPGWLPHLLEALDAGLDLASGLHVRLSDIPELSERAQQLGRQLHDVRHPRGTLIVGTGERRTGKRILTVGTDCSIGKMFTALSIEREMAARGFKVDFRATGQTGILIAGSGISVDAVVSDFISGATEMLSPAAEADHWDILEGQGSLMHPSFAGVSLGLLHGAQPDFLVMCHQPGRSRMRGLPNRELPSLRDCFDLNLRAARLTQPEVRWLGISLNTRLLPEAEARAEMDRVANEYNLPCVDPARTGVGALVDQLGCP